jgi:ATP-dependent DNA ligase
MVSTKDFMLCKATTKEEIPSILKLDSNRYLANEKMDGIRMMAIIKVNCPDVILFSRHGTVINKQFPELVKQLEQLPAGTILDGEVITRDKVFTNIQRRVHTKDANKISALQKELPSCFIVFDCLMYDSKVITNQKLKDRLVKLESLGLKDPKFEGFLTVAEFSPMDELWRKANSEMWEGIIVKDMEGIYEGNKRGWIKCKIFQEGEMVLTSYTYNPKGIRAEDIKGRAIQIAGKQSADVAKLIDKLKEVRVYIQYFSESEDGNYRMPTYRGLVKEDKKEDHNRCTEMQ